MTLASDIVKAAFREGNLVDINAVPTAAEQAEALARLNSFIGGVFGYEMGEQLSDWLVPAPQRTAPVAADFPQLPTPMDFYQLSSPFANDAQVNVYPYPPKNSRIVFGGVTNTVYFPEAPDDGSRMAVVQGSGAGDSGQAGATLTLDGNGRTIEGASTQEYSDPVASRQWLYRADRADWMAITTLALTDSVPFPSELDDLWITALAIRLCPRYSKAASAETQLALKQALAHFKARYRQAGVTTYGSAQFPNSPQSYQSDRFFWGG